MLRHRGVGDGELAWCCQQTAAEGAGMLECQRHNRFADFRIRLLQLLIFSHMHSQAELLTKAEHCFRFWLVANI